MEVGGRGRLYTYRYTVTIRMTSALKMGSDDSHFNASLTVRDKVTRQCPQTTTFSKRKESRSPSAYQHNALPLGQTGSRLYQLCHPVPPDSGLKSGIGGITSVS